MRDANDTIRLISRAFSETPQPGPEALFNHHCCECVDVSAAYAGKHWMDISLDDILAGRETALLSAAAWRYYLPAVMTWCIRAPDAVDVIQDNLVYQLEPPAEGRGVPEWFKERATGFSEEQRAAIVAYLHWYREREEAQWAGAEPPRHVCNALTYWAPNAPDTV
jgi:Family of unknown function (DUF6714)